MTIAGGIAAALFHRERTGEAHVVDVSLLGAGMWAMGAAIALSQDGSRWAGPPRGERRRAEQPARRHVPHGRRPLPRLLDAPRLPLLAGGVRAHRTRRLIDDPRFDSVEKLMENTAVAAEIVAAELSAHTLAEWRERFDGMKGQWAAVQTTVELHDDPQVQANGYLQDAETSEGSASTSSPRRCSSTASRRPRDARPSSTSTATPSSKRSSASTGTRSSTSRSKGVVA